MADAARAFASTVARMKHDYDSIGDQALAEARRRAMARARTITRRTGAKVVIINGGVRQGRAR